MRVVPIYCSLLSPLSFLRGPGFSFVSRDEVARPEKLAERGCVALLALRGCFLHSCVLRVLKDFAALFWSARLEDLGPRGVFTKGRGPGKPCQWGLVDSSGGSEVTRAAGLGAPSGLGSTDAYCTHTALPNTPTPSSTAGNAMQSASCYLYPSLWVKWKCCSFREEQTEKLTLGRPLLHKKNTCIFV